MGIIKILSVLFTIFTIVLIFNKNKTGNTSVLFGGLTFTVIMIYNYMGLIPINYFKVALFVFFSLMILTFGLMIGSATFMLSKSNKLSVITSIITSFVIMLLILNATGLLSFIFIPVLLYKAQSKFNGLMNY